MYRAPLAEGQQRYRKRRTTVAFSPADFDQIRKLAEKAERSFSDQVAHLLQNGGLVPEPDRIH